MELPFIPQYCPQSSLLLTNSRSQITTYFSKTLLKNGVKEITLNWSSFIGLGFFCSGDPYSTFQESGHFPVLIMLLQINMAGQASSGPNSCTNLLGTLDLGFLALLIFSYTSYSCNFGRSLGLNGPSILSLTLRRGQP